MAAVIPIITITNDVRGFVLACSNSGSVQSASSTTIDHWVLLVSGPTIYDVNFNPSNFNLDDGDFAGTGTSGLVPLRDATAGTVVLRAVMDDATQVDSISHPLAPTDIGKPTFTLVTGEPVAIGITMTADPSGVPTWMGDADNSNSPSYAGVEVAYLSTSTGNSLTDWMDAQDGGGVADMDSFNAYDGRGYGAGNIPIPADATSIKIRCRFNSTFGDDASSLYVESDAATINSGDITPLPAPAPALVLPINGSFFASQFGAAFNGGSLQLFKDGSLLVDSSSTWGSNIFDGIINNTASHTFKLSTPAMDGKQIDGPEATFAVGGRGGGGGSRGGGLRFF
jgi:hypothetical protein